MLTSINMPKRFRDSLPSIDEPASKKIKTKETVNNEGESSQVHSTHKVGQTSYFVIHTYKGSFTVPSWVNESAMSKFERNAGFFEADCLKFNCYHKLNYNCTTSDKYVRFKIRKSDKNDSSKWLKLRTDVGDLKAGSPIRQFVILNSESYKLGGFKIFSLCNLFQFVSEDRQQSTFIEIDGGLFPTTEPSPAVELMNAWKSRVSYRQQIDEFRAIEASKKWKIVLPAGEYYVGDPSYICPDKKWPEILATTNWLSRDPQVFRSHILFCHRIANRKGCWHNRIEPTQIFSIDSKYFGIVPMELVWKMNSEVPFDQERITLIGELGAVIKFDEPFEATADHGIFNFGDKVLINTTQKGYFGDEEVTSFVT
jgi:hypothetical protein